jgi:D-glycero-D-manno-heptose 1,7-bisphosphate phosphatase
VTERQGRPAVFLDRDGTLIEDPGYLADPAGVVLIPGAAEALARLEALGFLRIVITNQSGIARGYFDESAFHAVQREVERQLANQDASIDACLYCPHQASDGCACRKPGTALHREAASRFGIDLARSWCIGDRPGDVLPADALGAHALLVSTGVGSAHVEEMQTLGIPVVPDLLAAVAHISGRGIVISD